MKLSVVIPCYNEEDNISLIYEALKKEIGDIPYELIFIDDGSSDKTKTNISKIYNDDPDHVKGVIFSRNFGKEAAIYAGINNAKGEYTAIIDADLQQNPKYLMEMYNFLEKNNDYDQVAMYMDNRKNKGLKDKLSKNFYKVVNKVSDVKLHGDASDFRMFRQNVLTSIKELSEVNRFSKGIFAWVGFNTKYLPYKVESRAKGQSKFNFVTLLNYALEGLVGYSVKPLRFITLFGFIASFVAFVYFLFVIGEKIIFGNKIDGYTSIMASILLFSGIQILCMGILGEYLSKTYLETKKRPIYLEKEKIGFNDKNIL